MCLAMAGRAGAARDVLDDSSLHPLELEAKDSLGSCQKHPMRSESDDPQSMSPREMQVPEAVG